MQRGGGLQTVGAAAAILATGVPAVVAGSEQALAALPVGNWIGGTMRYFMTPEGACESEDRVMVLPMPVPPEDAWISTYEAAELAGLTADAPANGFSIVVVPSGSPAHLEYAANAPYYPRLFRTPIVGWISGVRLRDLGSVAPLVFDGSTGERSADRAMVLHVRLPTGRAAHISTANLFHGNRAGDTITFPSDGLQVTECLVNGEPTNFATYIARAGIDTRLPLVADYAGAPVSTSFQAVEAERGIVRLYAPVFAGIEYRIAEPVADYASAFRAAAGGDDSDVVFACNCILNYLYGELEGHAIGNVTGPMTFGEIAYQLLNQTLVRLSIVNA